MKHQWHENLPLSLPWAALGHWRLLSHGLAGAHIPEEIRTVGHYHQPMSAQTWICSDVCIYTLFCRSHERIGLDTLLKHLYR